MSEPAAEPAILDDAVLYRLDAQRGHLERTAAGNRAKAEALERQAAVLGPVRKFLEPRIGMTWDDLIADAEAALAEAEARAAAAGAEVERLLEHKRDLQGYLRVMEARTAELKAEEEQ